jgi:hypothetical protein
MVVYRENRRDPLTQFRYQNEMTPRDGTTKTTTEEEDKDHFGIHRIRP